MSSTPAGRYTDPLQDHISGTTWAYQVECSLSPRIRIGDVGPGGGIVFITPGTEGNSTGQYFEAAPHTSIVTSKWGAKGKKLGTTGTIIGAGVTNTASATATCADGACKIASKYSNNGFSDWFLPSKGELNAMYITRDFLGGLSTVSYWSSSEYGDDYAWAQDFGYCLQYDYDKDYPFYVRPVRAFS